MPEKENPPFNSYNVTIAGDSCVFIVCIFAMSEEAAEPMALDQLTEAYGIDWKQHGYNEITVELLDEDVL